MSELALHFMISLVHSLSFDENATQSIIEKRIDKDDIWDTPRALLLRDIVEVILIGLFTQV